MLLKINSGYCDNYYQVYLYKKVDTMLQLIYSKNNIYHYKPTL